MSDEYISDTNFDEMEAWVTEAKRNEVIEWANNFVGRKNRPFNSYELYVEVQRLHDTDRRETNIYGLTVDYMTSELYKNALKVCMIYDGVYLHKLKSTQVGGLMRAILVRLRLQDIAFSLCTESHYESSQYLEIRPLSEISKYEPQPTPVEVDTVEEIVQNKPSLWKRILNFCHNLIK